LKFLIDNALSPVIALDLKVAGHDAIHVRDIGLASATDDVLFLRAQRESRIIVSADTDFGTILALRGERSPSVILFRQIKKAPLLEGETILKNLISIQEHLIAGAIVVFEDTRIRIRRLPIGSATE
jgi:predicted nuclease of predicted toxin-antitoxin system